MPDLRRDDTYNSILVGMKVIAERKLNAETAREATATLKKVDDALWALIDYIDDNADMAERAKE